MACAVGSNATFTSCARREFAHRRQEWTRYYSHLFETLRQRGLLARLDALARSSQPPAKESLVCLAASAGVLTEWALKLQTRDRWSVVKYAASLVDDFFADLFARLDRLQPWTSPALPSVADLAYYGAKVRCARDALRKCLRAGGGGRRPCKERVFVASLDWVQTRHEVLTSDMVVRKVTAGRLPVELVDLVRNGLAWSGGREGVQSE